MDLPAWLQYLETFPSGINNNSLVKVKKLAQRLGLLNFSGKIVVVGGSNGKSSCVVCLETIFLAAGYTTGAYISPHVLRYNERIRVCGQDVAAGILCRIFAQIDHAREGIALSYFEFSTLAALAIFREQKLDILIFEVGLGGRFDAVNILDADIAIITTVSLEHTQILGNTKAAIAQEKAGIIRSCSPIIYGDANIPENICLAAKQKNASLYVVGKDFFYAKQDGKWFWQVGDHVIKNLPLPKLPLASVATALMVVYLLRNDFKIARRALVMGVRKATLLGRWQNIKVGGKEVIFDVAHNPESVALLAQNLSAGRTGRILAVVSMLSDKNIVASLQLLTKIVDKWYIGTLANKRAATVAQLTEGLGGCNFVVLSNIAAALQQAIAEWQRKDKIIVFGSFVTVADGLYSLYY